MENPAILQTQLSAESIAAIWREAILESRDAAAALGARPDYREKVRQYCQQSWLLGLPSGRSYLYPAFQFDVERRNVFEEVRRVNELLRAVDDPWGVASWRGGSRSTIDLDNGLWTSWARVEPASLLKSHKLWSSR